MAIQVELSSLIQSLQKLYSRMALFVLNYRTGHGKHRSVRHYNGDIASPLYEYIDRIVSHAQTRNEPGENNVTRFPTKESGATALRQSDSATSETSVSTMSSELADYFKDRKSTTLLIPEVGKKLKNSTWKHLHEAIRYGRIGEIKNAKLHADLANGTLKEALQYMSREEFKEFLDEIEKKFDEVLAEYKH